MRLLSDSLESGTGSSNSLRSTTQSISFCIFGIARNPRVCARFAIARGPRERLLQRHSPESSESYLPAILLGPSVRPSGPVLNPGPVSYKVAELMLKMRLRHSKIAYPYAAPSDGREVPRYDGRGDQVNFRCLEW
jgi:hypothetical protein